MCLCVRVRVHDVNLHCCHETHIIYVSVTQCLYILYEVETVKKQLSSFYLNLDIIIKKMFLSKKIMDIPTYSPFLCTACHECDKHCKIIVRYLEKCLR
jgi:hypothetical protein